VVQRNEARSYAKNYEQWANRSDAVHEFLWETFLDRDQILPDGGWADRPLEELEAVWRARVDQLAGYLERNGATSDQLNEVKNGLAGLDTREDGYGADHRRRLWNNMSVIPQNVQTTRGPRPTPPSRVQ
jgi:hypothetical protein